MSTPARVVPQPRRSDDSHRIPLGYKQTDVGVIPSGWSVKTLDEITALVTNGFVGRAIENYTESSDGVLYIQGYNIVENGFNLHGVKYVTRAFHSRHQKSSLRPGDLLTIQTGEIGVTAAVPAALAGSNCHALVISRFDTQLCHPDFYSQYFNSEHGRRMFADIQTGSTMKHLNVGDMILLSLPVPPRDEQQAIATALSDMDAMIRALDKLISKKRSMMLAASQQLLAGNTRLPAFESRSKTRKQVAIGTVPSDWGSVPIGRIAFASKRRNAERLQLPVLSCSKHQGFLDSLQFFKSQVFSRDTSGYRIILRGELGYPANHVEEGSIGLQTKYDAALVSPIYVVFAVTSEVNPAFLYRTLKRETYKQIFRAATMASVDRRGSLRWPAFSRITVPLPKIDEQSAIVSVLDDFDAEIAALEQRRKKTNAIRQGMMQALLSGRIRLIKSKPERPAI